MNGGIETPVPLLLSRFYNCNWNIHRTTGPRRLSKTLYRGSGHSVVAHITLGVYSRCSVAFTIKKRCKVELEARLDACCAVQADQRLNLKTDCRVHSHVDVRCTRNANLTETRPLDRHIAHFIHCLIPRAEYMRLLRGSPKPPVSHDLHRHDRLFRRFNYRRGEVRMIP